MARGIGYEFVDNHSQSPAAIRPKQQRTGGKHQVYFQAIKLGTTDREAELAKIGRRVNYYRLLASAMHDGRLHKSEGVR